MQRISRNELRGKAQTVLGIVEPQELGPTLMHEHLIWDITQPHLRPSLPLGPPDIKKWWNFFSSAERDPSNTTQRDVAMAVRAVEQVIAHGGKTIVELTTGGLLPDPNGLVSVSKKTGANIVMGCGHYTHDYQNPRNADRTVDDLAQEMVDQIQIGAWGTGVRAGIIGEIGCQWPWTDLEKKVLSAAVVAQKETGASLTIHPARHENHPEMLVDFLRRAGADLSRTIIDHIDRTIFDDDRLFRLADSGVVLEWDLFGEESTYYSLGDIDMPNDGKRIHDIKRVIDRGHRNQVVISHDICHVIRLSEFGGHGYHHIYRTVIPHMLKRGYSKGDIQAITVDNPRRLLTFV